MVRVAVLGCGLLGVKIAGELAYHGHKVAVYDNNVENLDNVYARVEDDKNELKEAGILNHMTFVGEVLCLTYLNEAVRDAEFIFEAIPEKMDLKQELFENVCRFCPENAIIATNTLRLDVDKIFQTAKFKERTIGIRFLYPVYCIPEVEVTLTSKTSIATLNKLKCFMERMSKTTFFRSGPEPLIFQQDQRDDRIEEHRAKLGVYRGLRDRWKHFLPQLAHMANLVPFHDGNSVPPMDSERECAICMNLRRDCVFQPCRHLCTCSNCGKLLSERRDCCPICRTNILEVIHIFHS